MDSNINIEIENKQLGTEYDGTPFKTLEDDSVYGKKIETQPMSETNIGVDTDREFFEAIIKANEEGNLDTSSLQSFTQLSQRRDILYQMLDSMCEDAIIAAIVRNYAEDATEANDQGKIVWVESSDANCAKMVSFLLDTINVDKSILKWMVKLCKYGDIYLRLYRESDHEDPLFKNDDREEEQDQFNAFVELHKEELNKKKKNLNEDIKVKAYSVNDHYSHYVELVPNPAEIFELSKFGKTQGYIQASISTSTFKDDNPILANQMRYGFKKSDVIIHEATDYVHACLEYDSGRIPEEVNIFLDDKEDSDKVANYTVKRGKSILYDAYPSWRVLSLLENSLMLNRVTKSQLIKLITVDVGSMPKETSQPLMVRLKNMLEQKTALNVGKYFQEYTNPGPIDNNVYWTTKNGVGTISIQNIGGEYDPKSLADIEYFRDRMFGALSVLKQYYGFTEDGAGFNGGQSLSIISARYAKTVKAMQNAMIQAITDMVNLMLIDKELDEYVNQFQIRMLPPITQEELDRRENLSNRLAVIQDTVTLLDGIEDPVIKLNIVKALLSTAMVDDEVISLIQEQIDELKSGEEEVLAEEPPEDSDEIPDNVGLGLGSDNEPEEPTSMADAIGSEAGVETEEEPSEDILPSGEELGIDLTDNNSPEFA